MSPGPPMLALLCLVLALGAPGPGASSEERPPAELIREGFLLFDQDGFAAARERFEQALSAAEAGADAATQAEAHRGLGRALFRLGRYDAAREQFERARELFTSLDDRLGQARCASHLGSVSLVMGDEKRAAELYRRALSEFETLDALRDAVDARYGLLFVTSDPQEQTELLRAGLAGAEALGDAKLQGKLLQVWSDIDFEQNRFASAAEKLERAGRLYEQAGARLEQGRSLNSLSRLERTHGQTQRALAASARALRLQEEIGDTPGMVQSLDQLADAHSLLGRHGQALGLYRRALELAVQTGSASLVSTMRARLAEAYLRRAENARAAELLEAVINGGLTPEVGAISHRQLARSYLGLRRYGDALAAAEKAVELAQRTAKLDALLPALHVRAAVREKSGRLEEALADAREEVAALERLRAQLLPADFMKRGFADQHQAAYGLTIGLLARAGRDRESLEVAEQARARAFLDLLAARAARTDQPEATHQGALPGGAGPPALPAAALTAPAATADDVVATARRLGSTMLSYFVGEAATFVWVVRPDGDVRVTRIGVPVSRVWELVGQTRTALRETGARRGSGGAALTTRGGALLTLGAGTRAWRRLYDVLIRPVRPQLPRAVGSRLTIVPHGPLFLLSFAALQDARGRYLVEDYALHYAPSAAVLQATARNPHLRRGAPEHRVFVADPRGLPSAGGRALPPLPGTRREVRAGSARLPPGDTVILAGRDATETNVRHVAPTAGLLHFATHGVVREDEPLDSFLALGGGNGDAEGDGRLTVQDIYGLDLQASLVVLSACRTGLGQLSSDGIMGLTRAFFYAGAPSVVATLWDVADEPTFRLVSAFYARLGREPDKASALRGAQLSMVRALRAGRVRVDTPAGSIRLPEHPVLWAGFVLVGEP